MQTLSKAIDCLVMECDLQPCTIQQYRLAISRFSSWLGHPGTTNDLTTENVNGFLVDLQKRFTARTVRNYRVCITRIWNYLSETEGLAGYNPRRLRRPKIESKPVTSWSCDQVAILIASTESLDYRLRCGLTERDFLAAWIKVGYDTGLRPIDLRLLRWIDIDFDHNSISITQHKTKNVHTAVLGKESIEALKSIRSPVRELVFPMSKGGLRRLEVKLFSLATRYGFQRSRGQGIGTLRKTHATEIYKTQGENAAAESLGHVGGVRTVRASYIDHRAVRHGRLPPSLGNDRAVS